MTLNLKAKIYTDEDAARKHLEALQWPEARSAPIAASLTRLQRSRASPPVPASTGATPARSPLA